MATPSRRLLLALLVSGGLLVSAPAEAAGPGTILFERNMLVKDKSGKKREQQRTWLMRGDGTRKRPLRPRLVNGFWIAGGRRIAAFDPRSGAARIVTVSRRGRDRRVIRLALRLDRANRISRLAWSPNGRILAFDYFSSSADTTRVFVRPVISGPERELPLGETDLLAGPDWSPDGKTIAAIGKLPTVVRRPDGQYTIHPPTVGVWLLDPAGGDPKRLATWPQDEGILPGDLAWSPDGSTIAVRYFVDADGPTQGGSFNDRDNHAQVLLVNSRTGTVRALPRDPKPGTFYEGVSWSPNGRYIGYGRSPQAEAWVMNVRTGERKRLVRDVLGFVWSPDSRRIAFSCTPYTCGGRPPGIWTASLNRKYKRLTRAGGRFFDFVSDWTGR